MARLDHAVVVMGVSGSGKSSVGAALAGRLHVPFEDADDLHPAANVAKMASGRALDDHDRFPWLERIGEWLAGHTDGGVIACSALKRKYRDQLRHHCHTIEFLFLEGGRDLVERRQSSRPGHFMPPSLLTSQYETLEPLQPDERGVVVEVDQSVDGIVDGYLSAVGLREGVMAPHVVVLETLVKPAAPGWQLITATLVAIAVLVVLITAVKLNPFIALIIGALVMGAVAGQNLLDVMDSFTGGFGDTAASVGILIALGAIFAKLLADSGGADQIVDTIVGRASGRALPWAMALVGAIIGLPMFFEIGLVLLIPVIYLVARRAQTSILTVGIPALAGLSAMHGFVPPHPGPVTAIGLLHANLGVTLGLGLIVAVPTVVVGGPLFGMLASRWVPLPPPEGTGPLGGDAREPVAEERHPSFPVTLATVLLPVVLMLSKAIADIVVDDENARTQQVFDVIGEPFVALLIGVLVAMVTFGLRTGMTRSELSDTASAGLPPIAGILLIVAAGGGFKQVLVDSGVGTLLANWAKGANVSILLLAWVLAVLIRLATGSATIATITASSLMIALVQGQSTAETSLVVLAVGAGSLFFSHVNDAGFWLVNQYFGLTVGQTLRTWSIMETVLSVTGLGGVLLVSVFV